MVFLFTVRQKIWKAHPSIKDDALSISANEKLSNIFRYIRGIALATK